MKNYILVIDDQRQFCELYACALREAGFEVQSALSAEMASTMIEQQIPDLIISDVRLPGQSGIKLLYSVREKYSHLPFLLVTAYADVRDAVTALKIGAVDYLEKPIDLEELVTAVCDALGTNQYETSTTLTKEIIGDVIAHSAEMRELLQSAHRVATSDATILITGESGTGKDVLANFIHRHSKRCRKPFVAVNCASIPSGLLESELFGHEKGAFTGAYNQRRGRFREASQGTLFLDEIGDMPLELQPALLRALETHCISPLGSDKEINVDFRLLAATNHNLRKDVVANKFREDLYYRINVISLDIPPLRQRIDDILPLAQNFLARHSSATKRLSRITIKILQTYPWPGNVRELANAMEHACLLANTSVVLPEHLPTVIRKYEQDVKGFSAANNEKQPQLRTLKENEIVTIKKTLEQTAGNRTQAAKILGITRRGLLFKLKRYGIE